MKKYPMGLLVRLAAAYLLIGFSVPLALIGWLWWVRKVVAYFFG